MTDHLQLFITGPYRSGTGFVSLLLGNHPALAVGHHTTNWFRERHCWGGAAEIYARKRWNLNAEFSPEIPYDGHSEEYGWEPADWDYTMQRLFGSPRWAEKQQLEWRNIPTFLDWFPDTGKALLVIRDPRSVTASFREYTYHDPPAYLQAPFVCLDAMQWVLTASERYSCDGWERLVEPATFRSEHLMPFRGDRFCVVRYKDVAAYTEEWLRELICCWLGLDWPGSEVMLSTENWEDVPGGPVKTRSMFDDLSDFDVDAAIHRWRDHLSEEETHFVETVCADVMEKYGYEPVTDCDMEFSRMAEMCEGDKVREWLEDWRETGQGRCEFPSDPTKAENWHESNVA